jgi:hypothetical protein
MFWQDFHRLLSLWFALAQSQSFDIQKLVYNNIRASPKVPLTRGVVMILLQEVLWVPILIQRQVNAEWEENIHTSLNYTKL